MKNESGVDLDVTWEPYELHPETPPEGIPLAQFFQGRDPESMFEHLRERGATLGRQFETPQTLPNTRPALMLAEFARDHGGLDDVHHKLFKAYFVLGDNINEEDVLRRIAGESGLDPDAAWAAIEDGRYGERLDQARVRAGREGITGTPAFILGEKYLVPGAQPYEVLERAVRRAAEEMGEATS